MKDVFTLALVIISLFGIFYCFNFFTKGDLTTNEQVLFSILLTIVSFLLSWALSHYYYELSHKSTIEEIKKENQSNLKIYATKAAEKVKNLSTEFTKLAAYLKEEYDENDYDSEIESLNAKRERIYSAIHIVNTLKSINEGTLSDWKGVIPDEIEEIVEEEREKVENINILLDRYKSVMKSEEEMNLGFEDNDLKEDIRELNRKLDTAISSVVGVTTKKTKKNRIIKEVVEKNCPSCGFHIQYKQRPIPSSRKWITCNNCTSKIACRWSTEKGFFLELYDEKAHHVESTYTYTDDVAISDDFVETVRIKLPPQPWPKKIGDTLAKDLDVSPNQVRKAINILIERGVFKHQLNGILYIPDPVQPSKQ